MTSGTPTVSADLTSVPAAPAEGSAAIARVSVRGKFLWAGDQKLYLRGSTYGPFRPEADGCEYHTPEIVQRDFAAMAAAGLNVVRVYTVPPRWLLDIAGAYGIRVLVGLPWEQHITFLDDRKRARNIVKKVREAVRTCAGHPALLAFAVGNEIPATIVRWHGAKRIEAFIHRLFNAVKAEDPEALVTYVNFPSTEYLYLPFLDFVCFNVYLESEDRLSAYLARLQNIAGDKPLLMAEIGLDSLRNGDDAQSRTMEWQIRTVFAAGCAGTFVFSWTDEWFRGGHDILDWKFGLTTIERQPKPALEAVRKAFENTPFSKERAWPKVSVVVCSRNGERTIGQTIDGLKKLDYPDFEVIVVDDGSTDGTARIVKENLDGRIRLITTEPRGLSAARNTGLKEAAGQCIAYLDDDAWPDPHWLMYLADGFMTSSHAGIGGPNVSPEGDGFVAQCVARSPGGPTHVLLNDTVAEHLPGCNMAFKAEALRAIGGFDEQFTIAGDDVDVCWRIQEMGWTLGYVAGAVVWHKRRDQVARYWRQQYQYGRAEAMLEKKWPAKYTTGGRISWAGRLYDRGSAWIFGSGRRRIYHGTWGSAPFQSIYRPFSGWWASVGLMPEWFLFIGLLAVLSLVGVFVPMLRWAIPTLGLAILTPIVQATAAARAVDLVYESRWRWMRLKSRGLITMLTVMQPIARLMGHLRMGMTPLRWSAKKVGLPVAREVDIWSETWDSPENRLHDLEKRLKARSAAVTRGGDYDGWDLAIRGGLTGGAQILLSIEEHGSGKQMARWKVRPVLSCLGTALILICALAGGMGIWRGHRVCAAIWFAMGLVAVARMVIDCGGAVAVGRQMLEEMKGKKA